MTRLKVGYCFECEGFYYVITQGSMDIGCTYIYKSKNFKVKFLNWHLEKTELIPNMTEENHKGNCMLDTYKLKPIGESRKLLTFKKNYMVSIFKEAELCVKWDDIKNRENNKFSPKYSKTFFELL